MKNKKQVYQKPEIEPVLSEDEDIVTASAGELDWNSDWTGDDWDTTDNTFIGD